LRERGQEREIDRENKKKKKNNKKRKEGQQREIDRENEKHKPHNTSQVPSVSIFLASNLKSDSKVAECRRQRINQLKSGYRSNGGERSRTTYTKQSLMIVYCATL
jgi:hypothetical protein